MLKIEINAVWEIVMTNNEIGTIFVKGKASGKYTCDRVVIKIEFFCCNASVAKASELALSQCEKFLERLETAGIDISMVQLLKDNIESSYSDNGIQATRTLKFDSVAKAGINNFILKIIQDEHLDAKLTTEYYLSNECDVRKELKRSAVINSRETAEIMAAAAGKEISGVVSIDMTRYQTRPTAKKRAEWADVDDFLCLFDARSEKLSMSTLDIEEEVEVTWQFK